jgi:hypothetical protein
VDEGTSDEDDVNGTLQVMEHAERSTSGPDRPLDGDRRVADAEDMTTDSVDCVWEWLRRMSPFLRARFFCPSVIGDPCCFF